jgi:flagellum-specific peptidoglycan hydrolase FlgJ
MTPQSFIEVVAPVAAASQKITGIAAAFVIAQGALESAWDKSGLAISANNLFGVKADPSWHGETIMLPTEEYLNGEMVLVEATWRKYPTWQAAFDDHAQFFYDNPRYADALKVKDDPIAFARAIEAAKYATDPGYADKIIALIDEFELTQYDLPSPGEAMPGNSA